MDVIYVKAARVTWLRRRRAGGLGVGWAGAAWSCN